MFKKILFISLIAIVVSNSISTNRALSDSNIKSLNAMLIQQDFSLVDKNEKKIHKFNLMGKPTILFFGFTHCPDVCPTTLNTLSTLLEKLGDDKNKFNIYFISVDPERDNTKILRDYLSSFDSKINGLTGDPKQIQILTSQFGIYVEKVLQNNGDYTMDHSAMMLLLDKNTKLVSTLTYQESQSVALDKLKNLLR
jgi:protein SCO1/2